MGKGGDFQEQVSQQNTTLSNIGQATPTDTGNSFTWDQIKESQKWVVINGYVYDVSKFSKKHPGGERILLNHVGQDASDAFKAFHPDQVKVRKYLKPIEIGKVINENTISTPEKIADDELTNDFRQVRDLAEKMDLFTAKPLFFILHFAQLLVFEAIAWYLLYITGCESWLAYILAAVCLTTTQAQAGWLQHDFGHLSVFKSVKLNHFVQRIIVCTIKGASADWWNYRHFQHHAKPNTIRKDPDIRFGSLFVLGKVIPRELGEKKLGKLPYQFQQNYFYLIMPPLLMPLYFNFEIPYYLIKQRKVKESLWTLSFVFKWALMFVLLLGVFGSIKLYFLMKFLESHWFVWTTQMSHIPMNIDRDQDLSWFKAQLAATCNVESSMFNDWFSGHLNYQIEHHLFPTMPRHSYHKIAPHVASLCKKHGIEYQNKSLFRAMADIHVCLKESGEMWYDAYNM